MYVVRGTLFGNIEGTRAGRELTRVARSLCGKRLEVSTQFEAVHEEVAKSTELCLGLLHYRD
jgi:hypothetical protein